MGQERDNQIEAKIQSIYGTRANVYIDQHTDIIGTCYCICVADRAQGTNVMFFPNKRMVHEWCDSVKFRVGDTVMLSEEGEAKYPDLRGVVGKIEWVTKIPYFSVRFRDNARNISGWQLLEGKHLKAVFLN